MQLLTVAKGFSQSNVKELASSYQSILNQYDVNHIDFDIEGANVQDTDANDLRSAALKSLQEQNPSLTISYTLPVLPTGLTGEPTNVLGGYDVVESSLKAGVDIAGVNIMTMDFGDDAAPMNKGSMGEYTIEAATKTHDQMVKLFTTYEQTFGWENIGITPMVGINDVHDEVFFISDAKTVLDFAHEKGIGMMSMWELTRDVEMPENQTYLSLPADTGLTGNASSKNPLAVKDPQYIKGGFTKTWFNYQPQTPSTSFWDQSFAPYVDFAGWCSDPCKWPIPDRTPDYMKTSGPYDPYTIAKTNGWTENQRFNLAFIQSAPTGKAAWGGTDALSIDNSNKAGLDQLNAMNASMKLIKENGGSYAISFGGASGLPLAAHVLSTTKTKNGETSSDGHVHLPSTGGNHATLVGDKHTSVVGNQKGNTITGNSGDNVIEAGKGKDIVNAGDGHDAINAGKGKDVVNAGDGHDTVNGGGGMDFIHGGAGNDSLSGQKGHDVLYGGAGNDTLNGGNGKDTMIGGQGADTFIFSKGNNLVDDFRFFQNDQISFPAGADYTVTQSGYDSVIKSSTGGTLTLIGVSSTELKNKYAKIFAVNKPAPTPPDNNSDPSKGDEKSNLFKLSFDKGGSWSGTTSGHIKLENISGSQINSDWSVSFHSDKKISNVSNFTFQQKQNPSGGYDITLTAPSWRTKAIDVDETLSSYFQVAYVLEAGEELGDIFNSISSDGTTYQPTSPENPSTVPIPPSPSIDPTKPDPSSLLDGYTPGTWGSKVFAPYVDITRYPTPNLKQKASDANVDISKMQFNIAFIQSTNDGKPAWGGNPTLEITSESGQARNIKTSLAEAQLAGAEIAISFGGEQGTSLAVKYQQTGQSAQTLADTYEAVMETFKVNRLDFDIEGGAASNTASIDLRSKAIDLLQDKHPDLGIWFTIAVLPTGLTSEGLNIVKSAIDAGVDIGGVNIMAMDYGPSFTGNMGDYANQAAEQTLDQITGLFKDAGSEKTFDWENIGITPMIGINDVSNNIFTVDDAKTVEEFANQNGVGMIAMWELGRDTPGTSGGYSNTGLNDPALAFTQTWADYGV